MTKYKRRGLPLGLGTGIPWRRRMSDDGDEIVEDETERLVNMYNGFLSVMSLYKDGSEERVDDFDAYVDLIGERNTEIEQRVAYETGKVEVEEFVSGLFEK